MNLTETHIHTLQRAADNPTGLLHRPRLLKGASVDTFTRKLLRLGLVEVVAVNDDEPIWWIGDNGIPQGLRITPDALPHLPGFAEISPTIEAPEANLSTETQSSALTGESPRRGTKLNHIIALLSHPDGATIEDLLAATGWLPHSLRASLSRLVKRGFPIERLAPRGQPARLRMRPEQ